ncbi:hypothetical protein BJ878DRAFT_256600 [Calycina marina]|uniref:Kinesin light chain n=1 Tax=Calycina marina TaxID=1763456 RepID=A0A9P7YVX5_9HELO|nr:hypothetical protein BJ878DRAFT_256600 [Calycina marina]
MLGSQHPNTLQSMRNVGKALETLGRFPEAELMYRAALLGRVKILGDDHPHTRQVKQDLEGLAAVMSTEEGEKGAGYLTGGRQESDDPDIHADTSVGVEVPRISGPSS